MRLVEHLLGSQDERDLTDALIQAAAVWGDLDARLYRRTPDEAFALHALLPSLRDTARPRRVPASLVAGADKPFRVSSISELEQLGWTGPHTEVLVIPPSPGDEWLLVVGGTVEPHVERVLAVAAKTLSLRTNRAARLRPASAVSDSSSTVAAEDFG